MSNRDKTNTGVLFKNKEKTSEKRPDYTGSINVDGVEKRLAAWINESKSGTKYMSISVSEPYKGGDSGSGGRGRGQPRSSGKEQYNEPGPDEYADDDDIPF